jgi:hypothetical protein
MDTRVGGRGRRVLYSTSAVPWRSDVGSGLRGAPSPPPSFPTAALLLNRCGVLVVAPAPGGKRDSSQGVAWRRGGWHSGLVRAIVRLRRCGPYPCETFPLPVPSLTA